MFLFVLFGAIHHAIIAAVVAFFVLFAAGYASGFVKILGNVLGWLLLIIAVLALVCGISSLFFGGQPLGMMWDPGWHHMAPFPSTGK